MKRFYCWFNRLFSAPVIRPIQLDLLADTEIRLEKQFARTRRKSSIRN